MNDTCAACGRPKRLRKDGRIARHNAPRASDSGWSWRHDPSTAICPGSGQRPAALHRTGTGGGR